MVQPVASRDAERHAFIKGVHGVRYQVKDVARAVAFYTQHLGFTLEHQQLPAFASVSLGGAQVLLSGSGASAPDAHAGSTCGFTITPTGQLTESRIPCGTTRLMT